MKLKHWLNPSIALLPVSCMYYNNYPIITYHHYTSQLREHRHMSTPDPSPDNTELTVDQFLTKLFLKFDSNSDGRLSSYEFTEALKYLTKVLGATLPNRNDVQ